MNTSPVYVTQWVMDSLAADFAAALQGGERNVQKVGLVVGLDRHSHRPAQPNPPLNESAGPDPYPAIAAAALRDAAEQLDQAGQRAAALFVTRLANKHEANAS